MQIISYVFQLQNDVQRWIKLLLTRLVVNDLDLILCNFLCKLSCFRRLSLPLVVSNSQRLILSYRFLRLFTKCGCSLESLCLSWLHVSALNM